LINLSQYDPEAVEENQDGTGAGDDEKIN